MKNIFNQRINSIITAALLILCAVLLPGCERNDILVLMEDSSQFGDGSDGDIVITGSVNIADLYEDDVVTGVTTRNGINKGLNHGAGSYSPQNRRFINATNFTINSGATLYATAWDGSDSRLGIVWIACTATFTNNATINLTGCGGAGGVGSNDESTPGEDWNYKRAGDGIGSGGGGGAGLYIGNTGKPPVNDSTVLAEGRTAYGTAGITLSTWNHLYGSGGGGGSGTWMTGSGYGGAGGSNANSSSDGGVGGSSGSSGQFGAAGGRGGGALRIYAVIFTHTGAISCNGNNGSNASWGGGGGGSGGTIYIEATECNISTGSITCTGGGGGTSSGTGDGSNGSVGRIAIKSPDITGSITNPVYYNILQGSY